MPFSWSQIAGASAGGTLDFNGTISGSDDYRHNRLG
jgi:hypothetical protein